MAEYVPQEAGIRTLRVEAPPGSHMDHVLVTLVGEGPYILIDSGYKEGTEKVLTWLGQNSGGELDTLLLTHHHRDHLGGAEAIVSATGAKAHAHPIEIELMKECAPGLTPLPLEGGGKIRVGDIELEAFFTPGHSPGHLAFWWRERGVLFGGDNVLMPITTWVGPPLGSLRVYLQTLEKVRDLSPRVIFPGHGPPVTDPGGRVEALLRHRAQRERQVLAALSDGLETPEEMAQRIYRGMGEKVIQIGATMLTAHLEKLAEEGRVESEEGKYILSA